MTVGYQLWSAPQWHHLADDSGIPISNYKQDLCSIRVVCWRVRWVAGQDPAAKVRKAEERVRQLPSFLSHLLAAGLRRIWFSSLRLVKISLTSSRNDQVFVSGHLIMFSLPVMKAVTGVSALGGNGGLFIPLKAQHHTCFARSVICNCGISWEALEQSTLCSGRDPS